MTAPGRAGDLPGGRTPQTMPDTSSTLYRRDLPSGGYVRIDGFAHGDAEFVGMLRVERRGDPTRRFGHPPPIVLEHRGSCQEDVLDRLIEIAKDNVALASAILRWQGRAGGG